MIFNVTDGYLTINKANVEVLIAGNTDINEYLGYEQSVTGYTVSTTNTSYNTASVVFQGNATASGTAVGIYTMGLNASQFTNTDDNYNVSFNISDGWLEIVKAGVVIVEIVGNQSTLPYNGEIQSVSGYVVDTVKGRNELGEPYASYYPSDNDDIQFTGSAVAQRRDVGTTMMGLTVDNFANTNEDFLVRFHVTDGYLTIDPLDVIVTIAGKRLASRCYFE